MHLGLRHELMSLEYYIEIRYFQLQKGPLWGLAAWHGVLQCNTVDSSAPPDASPLQWLLKSKFNH